MTQKLAFEALVVRHGPAVMRVCRSVLDRPTTPRTSSRRRSWSSSGVPNRSLVQRSWAHGSEASRANRAEGKVADLRRRLHERRFAEKSAISQDVRRELGQRFTRNLTGCPNHCEPPWCSVTSKK